MAEKVGILGLVKVEILGGVNWAFLLGLNLFFICEAIFGVLCWVRCV